MEGEQERRREVREEAKGGGRHRGREGDTKGRDGRLKSCILWRVKGKRRILRFQEKL